MSWGHNFRTRAAKLFSARNTIQILQRQTSKHAFNWFMRERTNLFFSNLPDDKGLVKHAQSLREHAGNGIPRFETGRYKFQATLDVPGSLENIAFFFFFHWKACKFGQWSFELPQKYCTKNGNNEGALAGTAENIPSNLKIMNGDRSVHGSNLPRITYLPYRGFFYWL